MDGQVLYFPQGKDVVVTARYPGISSGTGSHSEFYYKDNRYMPDSDPSVHMYSAPINPDPDNAGATMSVFNIPDTDNEVTGAFWWRIDVVDSASNRRYVEGGTLLVEAVLWLRKLRERSVARNGLCTTGLREQAGRSSSGACQVTLTAA